MATITLTADTAYSALTVASGDTIALDGHALTLDVGSPSATGVTVTAVGNAGTVVIGTPTSYVLTGWTLRAGIGTLIASVDADKTIDGATIVAGTATSAHGISLHSGVLRHCTLSGDTGFFANAISNSLSGSLIEDSTLIGGSGTLAFAVSVLRGTLRRCDVTGGSGPNAWGIYQSYDAIVDSTLTGSANNSALQLKTFGLLVDCNLIGGSAAGVPAVSSMDSGAILNLTAGEIVDNAGPAIGSVGGGNSPILAIRSSNLKAALPAGFSKLIRIGGSTYGTGGSIAGSPTIVDLYETGSSSAGPRLALGEVLA